MGFVLRPLYTPPPSESNIKYALLKNKGTLIKFFSSDYQIKGSNYLVLDWFKISEEIINTDFVKNLCDRDMSFINRKFVGANDDGLTHISSGYNLSKKEYERILSLVVMSGSYENFIKLAKYP